MTRTLIVIHSVIYSIQPVPIFVAESFSWDAYLKGCDDKPAPRSCFKQAHTPPANLFQLGHKLESRDPRNSMSYCIATVVYVKGTLATIHRSDALLCNFECFKYFFPVCGIDVSEQ